MTAEPRKRPLRPDMVPYGDDPHDDGTRTERHAEVVHLNVPAVVEPEPTDIVVEEEPLSEAAEALQAMAAGPEDVWWERALIGAVLQGYDDVSTLLRITKPSDFHEPMHEAIWTAIVSLWHDGERATVMMVMDRMGSLAHRLPRGAIYLSDLAASMDIVPFQAPHYAKKLRECELKRQIQRMGIRATQLVQDPDADPDDFLGKLQQWFDTFTDEQNTGSGSVTEALEAVIDIAQNGQTHGIPSPWGELDSLIGGAYPEQLIVCGARPGVGKTLLLENWASHIAAMEGHEVLFCSMEMSKVELTQRALAHTAKVELTRLRNGKGSLTERDWEKIAWASPRVEAAHMSFVDHPTQTVSTIVTAARQAAQRAKRHGRHLSLVCVDYAGLVTQTNLKLSRQQHIGEVSRGLKKLAKELRCTVLLAAQLNRDGKGRANPLPQLTDLREAGDLEQDADVVILMHEDEFDGVPSAEVKLLVPKQRNGPTGHRTLFKWGHYAALRETGS